MQVDHLPSASHGLGEPESAPRPVPAASRAPGGVMLCYARGEDWDLVRARLRPTPVWPDGRLELRAPPEPSTRLVRPRVFLGRRADGRLAFLCDVLDA